MDTRNAVIEKVEDCKRGFGRMTAALFRNPDAPKQQSGWDYVEVTCPTKSEYQRDSQSLSDKDAKSLVGMRLKDIPFMVHAQKWHRCHIDQNGNITSLKC